MASPFDRTPDDPLLIGALHLPDLSVRRHLSPAYLEDYALKNAEAFIEGGIRRLFLQDQTRQVGPASVETIALAAAIGRSLKLNFPALSLGIIVQAHDARAPLAIARATGADFVRIKIFVGAAMTFEGPREALGVEAVSYRHQLGCEQVAIMADVLDRTCMPMVDIPFERAALAAARHGADALVLTGETFAHSLERIASARAAGVKRPLILGGSVDRENVERALSLADGVIVSSALMREGTDQDSLLRWDAGKVRALVDAAIRVAA